MAARVARAITPEVGRRAEEAWPAPTSEELLALLAETAGAAPDSCSSWLPVLRTGIEALDDAWAAAGSEEPGAATVEAHRLAQLSAAATEGGANLPALRATLLRRLHAHLRTVAGAPTEAEGRLAEAAAAAVMTDGAGVRGPRQVATARRAAAELFDAATEVVVLLGHVPDVFAEPLSAALRAATVPGAPRDPLLVGPLLSVLVADLRAGRKYPHPDFAGKALLNLVIRVLECGDRCGADALDTVVHAMRAAAWLATGIDCKGSTDAALDAIAVANARHGGALVDESASAWLEARHARDMKCVMSAPGNAVMRRGARKLRCTAERGVETWGPAQADIRIPNPS